MRRFLRPLQKSRTRPHQIDADLARHAAREIENLRLDLVALRLELFLEDLFVSGLGATGERFRPVLLEIVDRPALVGKPRRRKAHHHDIVLAALDCGAYGAIETVGPIRARPLGHERLAHLVLVGLLLLHRLHGFAQLLALDLLGALPDVGGGENGGHGLSFLLLGLSPG